MGSLLGILGKFENNEKMAPYGALVLRLTLSLYWAVHCLYKILYQGMDKTEQLFIKLGYPAIFAWGDIALELVAMVAFALGIYTRSISLLTLLILIPAMEIWIPNGLWALKGGYEFMVLWCLLQVVLTLTGPGPHALKLPRPRN